MVLARHGAALLHVGKIHDARFRLNTALSLAGQQGRDGEEAFCLRYLAQVEAAAGVPSTAEEYARASILFARRSADPHELVLALREAAQLALRAGTPQRAVELLLEAVGVEVPSSAKGSAWRALIDALGPLMVHAPAPLTGTVLNQILTDGTAEPEILASAQRLLDSLRVIHEPVIGDSIIAFPR